MDSYMAIVIMLAAGGGFLFYLFRTGQFKWLFRILRNAVMGVAGLLTGNWLLAREKAVRFGFWTRLRSRRCWGYPAWFFYT